MLHVADCPNLSVVRDRINQAVARAALEVTVEERLVRDSAEAANLGFTGSPTILVEGVDAFAVPGSIPSLSCRLYRSDAGLQGAPTVEALLEVLRP